MTPEQKKLARHALGLDNPKANGRSYRNRYFIHHDSPDWGIWHEMVVDGNAYGHLIAGRADTAFHLTEAGARLALTHGETLDREDFPEAV